MFNNIRILAVLLKNLLEKFSEITLQGKRATRLTSSDENINLRN